LKVEDWLDIYLNKKDVDNYLKDDELNNYKINLIKENIIQIDDYFIEMFKCDKLYFHCFLLMIYNFKWYFSNKEGRVLKNKKDL
jgi:hypothetical protein